MGADKNPTRPQPGKDVLVVDDDPDIRDALGRVLELEGYQVRFAENGKDALDKLESSPRPSVILLDLMMPVMNGLDFLERLRANARIAETPVIIASAFREMASRAPAQAILTKPLDLDVLLENVARLSGQGPAGSSTTNVAP